MANSSFTGLHCAFCNGPVLRLWEWGASWLECQSCGCQRPIALLDRVRRRAKSARHRTSLCPAPSPETREPSRRRLRARSRARMRRPCTVVMLGNRGKVRR